MRRRVRTGLTHLIVACWFAAVGASCSAPTDSAPAATSRSETTRPSLAATAATPAFARCDAGSDQLQCADVASMESAPVLRIVDGDTLHVEYQGRDESVRLYGIDAPEVGMPCAIEATERLRALAGSIVRMRRDARDRDRYKRLLRYVYTPSGESIDGMLVREGLAHAWRADGALKAAISALETDARNSRRGCLWRGM